MKTPVRFQAASSTQERPEDGTSDLELQAALIGATRSRADPRGSPAGSRQAEPTVMVMEPEPVPVIPGGGTKRSGRVDRPRIAVDPAQSPWNRTFQDSRRGTHEQICKTLSHRYLELQPRSPASRLR